MNTRFGLQYKVISVIMKLFSSCCRRLYYVMAAGFMPGPEDNMVKRIKCTAIIYAIRGAIATMEKEIVGVSVRLNQAMRQ